jgi:peptide/nickel transport system permease protein
MSPNPPVALELLDADSRERELGVPTKLVRFGKRLLREQPLGAAGGVICLAFLFAGVFASALAPYAYDQIDPVNRLHPPSWAFPLGTDNLGRDMLSRVLYGARLSVIIALSSAALATVISTIIGIVSGYLGGATDMIIQRFVDAWMSFPDLIVLIVMVSVFGPGMVNIVVTLGLLFGIGGSRIVRGAVVAVREHTYVHAAQSIGASTFRILWSHVLPNVLPPVIVLFTTRLGAAILAESGLSFLGLGVPPPAPSWGGMLTGSGRTYMFQGPWLALAPGLSLTIVVFATNVFGDALRDLLDPRMRGTR